MKFVLAPPVGFDYIIDADTVADVDGSTDFALVPQPIMPALEG